MVEKILTKYGIHALEAVGLQFDCRVGANIAKEMAQGEQCKGVT